MQALDKLSNAIYLESQFYGPESIYLCSSYFYMGEVFKKEGQVQQAKNFYQKMSLNPNPNLNPKLLTSTRGWTTSTRRR